MTSVPALECLLGPSPFIAYGRFSPEGELREANPRLTALLSGVPGPVFLAETVVEGQREEVLGVLRERQAMESPRYLHFAQGDASPVTLVVRWQWEGDELVLVGEPPVEELEASQGLLVKLNNRVSELARENAKKSAQLEKALSELREAQAMLVHREKMAALGRTTAGVAHELNNPLAYVKNNQYLLKRGFTDLLALVNLLGDGLEDLEANCPGLYAAIMEKVQEIDLPHLSESIPRLLDSLEGGVDRATALVRQLRTFSRLDEAEYKSVDLNESLRSVVEMAGFLMREQGVEFRAEYGDLSPVTCSPGQVNQAVLNILTNAIQAAGENGRVGLATRQEEDSVVIVVTDSGPGVPEEMRERIFEPFVTTKPVGEGTGLGLSIAHTVIAEHGGSIDVGGGQDGGAVFTVRLPAAGSELT